MAASEIDHLISLSLFRLANISFASGFVLVGKMVISTKLKHLDYLINAHADEELCVNFSLLQNRISEFNVIRNAIAHGTFIGDVNVSLYFDQPVDYSDTEGHHVNKVVLITPSEIKDTANKSSSLARITKDVFGVDLLNLTSPLIILQKKPESRRSARKSKPAKNSS